MAVSVAAVLNLLTKSVHFGVLISNGEEWRKRSSYHCSKNFGDVGVLEFLQTEPDPHVALVFFTLWRQSLKVIISSSWSLPISAPGKLTVCAMFSLDWKHRFAMM